MNPRNLVMALVATGMLASLPTVSATDADLYGFARAEAEAKARVDASGAFHAAHETRERAVAYANATVASAHEAVAAAKANASARFAASARASENATGTAREDVRADREAYLGWASHVSARPRAETNASSGSTTAAEVVEEATTLDGSFRAHAASGIVSTARVDYDLPPPPRPTLGFVAALKVALAGFFALR